MSPSSVVLLPYAPSSVAAARWQLSTDLREAGMVAAAIGDAALVLSELLSNAIRHARPLPGAHGPGVVDALATGHCRYRCSDGGGPTRPHAGHLPPSSLGGRGLAIVECLCQHLGSPDLRRRDDGLGRAARAAGPGGAGAANRPCSARPARRNPPAKR